MKNPTLRKLRNRGLTPIRYTLDPSGRDAGPRLVRHGYIVRELPRGSLVVRLIGDERNRRLSPAERRYVEVL